MLIVHRCTVCNHPDVWANRDFTKNKKRTNCTNTGCCSECNWDPQPVTMPRWNHTDNTPITAPAKPGESVKGYTSPTCDCAACKALYKQLTSGKAAA